MSTNRKEIRDEIEESAPALHSIEPKKIEAPATYFDSLAKQVLKETRVQETKVLPLFGAKTIVRWAVAASVAGLIGIGLYMYQVRESPLLAFEHGTEAFSIEDQLLAMDDDLFYEIYLEEISDEKEEEDIRIEYLLENEMDLEAILNDLNL